MRSEKKISVRWVRAFGKTAALGALAISIAGCVVAPYPPPPPVAAAPAVGYYGGPYSYYEYPPYYYSYAGPQIGFVFGDGGRGWGAGHRWR